MNELASGFLSELLLRCLILALPVSILLLMRYRKELLRGMLSASAGARAADAQAPAVSSEADEADATTARPPGEAQVRRRLLILHCTAGAVSSLVATALLYRLDAIPFSVSVAYGATWPLAATLPVVLAFSKRQTFQLAAAWFLLGAVIVVAYGRLVLQRQPLEVAIGYTVAIALLAFWPWAMVLLTGNRRLRAVSPVVLGGLLLFISGAMLAQQAFYAGLKNRSLREVVLSTPWADSLWFLLASLPVALVCWLALRWLSRQYEAKKYSDTQLVVDSCWLLAAFSLSTYLAVELGWSGLIGLASFAAYRIALEAGFRLWPHHGANSRRRLLLLRVFGFRRRTEALFDAVAQRWRLTGSVNLIAGTDLAGRTVDPGEMIRFMAGNIGDQFVLDASDLERRLNALDDRPDPDGRFRINDVSCHDNTWKATLLGLLKSSELVLMDLRGFSSRNAGCRFEFESIAQQGRLSKTLFVIDKTTDVELLRSLLPEGANPRLTRIERKSTGRLRSLQAELAALAG